MLEHKGNYHENFRISDLTVSVVGNFPHFPDFSEAMSKFRICNFELIFWDYFKDRDFIENIEEMIIQLKNIPKIKINFQMKNMYQLNEHFFYSPIGRGLSFCTNLADLCIEYGCYESEESEILFKYLTNLKKLVNFRLKCSLETEGATALAYLFTEWKLNLKSLNLILNPFKQDTRFPPHYVNPYILGTLVNGIKQMTVLEGLDLELGYCRHFTRKEEMTQASKLVSEMTNLKTFKLNVQGKYLSKFELKEFAKVLKNHPSLHHVELFGDVSNISDHQRLPLISELKKLPIVKEVKLYLYGISEGEPTN